jgi:hypothetical protein
MEIVIIAFGMAGAFFIGLVVGVACALLRPESK